MEGLPYFICPFAHSFCRYETGKQIITQKAGVLLPFLESQESALCMCKSPRGPFFPLADCICISLSLSLLSSFPSWHLSLSPSVPVTSQLLCPLHSTGNPSRCECQWQQEASSLQPPPVPRSPLSPVARIPLPVKKPPQPGDDFPPLSPCSSSLIIFSFSCLFPRPVISTQPTGQRRRPEPPEPPIPPYPSRPRPCFYVLASSRIAPSRHQDSSTASLSPAKSYSAGIRHTHRATTAGRHSDSLSRPSLAHEDPLPFFGYGDPLRSPTYN